MDIVLCVCQVVDMSSPTFTIQPSPSEPVMPKTMTPDMATTTPKADKPDVIQPSKTPDKTVEVTKTPTLPQWTPTPKPMVSSVCTCVRARV